MVAYKEGVTLGTVLRARLDELGMKPADLSDHFKISQATASRWLNDKMVPESRNLRSLADFLGWEEAEVALVMVTGRGHSDSNAAVAELREALTELAERFTLLEEAILDAPPRRRRQPKP